jgi:hypothetical protein
MTAELDELTAIAAELPPERLLQVINFARMLRNSPTGEIDMSDLTTEDLRAESNRVMQQFEEEHGDEDWGDLKPMNPGERYK